MFFFIAGIQPKTKTLDKTPRFCPVCGMQQAYLKRIDHYLSLFFIPLVPVKQGQPFLVCENCERVRIEKEHQYEAPSWDAEKRCRSCGRALEKDFLFCPYCGRQL
jgi:RNA polymerase subunit RPABC4/transcription elongation factor Spt4